MPEPHYMPSPNVRFLDYDRRDLVEAAPDAIAAAMRGHRGSVHPLAVEMMANEITLEEVAATIGRDELAKKGKNCRGIVHAVDAALTTDDLGDVLAEAVQRIVSASYTAAADHQVIAAPVNAPDYHPVKLPELDIETSLDRVFENEEINSSPVKTATGQTVQLKTWGRMLTLTRKVIANDTNGLIDLLGRRFGDAAARNEASELYSIIEDNPTLSDGSTLWSGESVVTGHGTLSATSLEAGMSALRTQKTSGGHKGNFTAKHLVVHPDEERTAHALVRDISVGNTPRMRVTVSPWLSTGSFYLLADPQVAPVVGLVTLQGRSQSWSVARGFDRKNRRQLVSIWQDMATVALSRIGGVKVTT